jgi:hypothetical protein
MLRKAVVTVGLVAATGLGVAGGACGGNARPREAPDSSSGAPRSIDMPDSSSAPQSDAATVPDASSTQRDAAPPMAGAASLPPRDGGLSFGAAKVCSLSVGAPCDGPEDCPLPQSCCATFDPVLFRYTDISCQRSCTGINEFELCHPERGCRDAGDECRRSSIVPHDFITVCAQAARVPTETTSREVVGAVLCGSDQCKVGSEQCCLRSEFDFSTLMSTPLEPYCAPLGAACDCAARPPLGADDDGGMVPGE